MGDPDTARILCGQELNPSEGDAKSKDYRYKDNFDEMESYVLSLQWKTSDGTKQSVDNVQIYKDK